MFARFSDPFEAMFALQRALDARIASDWMGRGTAAIGSYPPINVFQKGEAAMSPNGMVLAAPLAPE
jgi:HSP20 family protein